MFGGYLATSKAGLLSAIKRDSIRLPPNESHAGGEFSSFASIIERDLLTCKHDRYYADRKRTGTRVPIYINSL